ncbi:MAG: hypothetical protein U5L01_02330 [Rheinheimera sp.]|nr:hypothetical protein [Rheinheimera sp.]
MASQFVLNPSNKPMDRETPAWVKLVRNEEVSASVLKDFGVVL